ncbi:MAG: dienelactone hydrolase, partial [Gammaproteobacteria bacterium]|nr:dienelactone hydrolase [Gammaproteobacteria bacterium]
SGKSDRAIKVEVWYPAVATARDGASSSTLGQSASTIARAQYGAALPRAKQTGDKAEFFHTGIAIRDALPVATQRFPLVLVSHGFGGWGTFMTYLTENLASKGYMVIAIDHQDAAFTDGASFALSFGSTIVHRARDQQFVLDIFANLGKNKDTAFADLAAAIDVNSIAVIGYSMGGFGALATAGAGYDAKSPTFKDIPAAIMAPQMAGNRLYDEAFAARRANIKALVLMAPWGAQLPNRAWTSSALQNIKAPTLIISGDEDDIVNYKGGIQHLFQAMTSSARHLLVFQQARHNVGGNPAPVEALADFSTREYFDEPVWRKDRLNAINQHFVTAFLDLHLKGMVTRAAYLDTPTVKASEAKWPVAFGQNTSSATATAEGESAQYWQGFHRRWALGLEMHRLRAGDVSK